MMPDFTKPHKSTPVAENDRNSGQETKINREQKLAKQLRDNLVKRKNQSKARNTKPRKFKKPDD